MNQSRMDILSQFYEANYHQTPNFGEDQEVDNDINFLRQNLYLQEASSGGYLLAEKGINYVEAQALVEDDLMREHKKIRNGLKYAHEKLQEGDSHYEQTWRNQMVGEGIDNATITAIQEAMTHNGML